MYRHNKSEKVAAPPMKFQRLFNEMREHKRLIDYSPKFTIYDCID
jgi:hypothetical protein